LKAILVVVPDLMFEMRVADVARAMGYAVEMSTERVAEASLIVVGLEDNRDWQSLVKEAGSHHVPVLAFGRHTSVGLLRQAREAGCARVVVNSEIAEQLPKLLGEMLA
jgi:hypothetical protein